MPDTTSPTLDIPPLPIGRFQLRSRLVAGTGKYADASTMQAALLESGCDAVTVAVRRERLYNDEGRSLLEDLDLDNLFSPDSPATPDSPAPPPRRARALADVNRTPPRGHDRRGNKSSRGVRASFLDVRHSRRIDRL